VADCPAVTVWFEGCVVIEGGVFTVSVAALLVALPKPLLMVTTNNAPLSEAAVAGVVYEAPVAPVTALPFLLHW
jgi:hypothetical protein